MPAKTPRTVVSMLAAQMAAVLARPDVRAEFERRALFAETSTPQDLSALVASNQAAWLNLLTEFRVGSE